MVRSVVLLPDELLALLFSFFEPEDVLRLMRVCRHFNQIITKNESAMRRFKDTICIYEGSYPPTTSISLALENFEWRASKCEQFKLKYMDSKRIFRFSLEFFKPTCPNSSSTVDNNSLPLPFKVSRRDGSGAKLINIKTRLPFAEALPLLLNAIKRRFTFRDATFMPQCSHLVFHLKAFPELRTLEVFRFDEPSILSALESLPDHQIRSLEVDGNSSATPFTRAFYEHRQIRQLQEFRILDCRFPNSNITKDFDHANLLSLKASTLVLEASYVSTRGIRKLLEEWKNGKRHIKYLDLVLRRTPQTVEGLFKEVHTCEDDCVEDSHFVFNNDRSQKLHLKNLDNLPIYFLRNIYRIQIYAV